MIEDRVAVALAGPGAGVLVATVRAMTWRIEQVFTSIDPTRRCLCKTGEEEEEEEEEGKDMGT